ncbi:hypothetical protein ACQ4PT_027872 [Festuca glaucescens]
MALRALLRKAPALGLGLRSPTAMRALSPAAGSRFMSHGGPLTPVLRTAHANRCNRWIQNRIDRYGPVWKASVLRTPTVFLTGLAANKFIFFSSALRARTPRSFQRIFGEKSIVDMHGDDHRRIRGALMEFLRPDMLKLYVGSVDAKVRRHLEL